MITYDSIPTVDRFKHDSSVRLAIRSRDRALGLIDEALARVNRRPGHFTALAELFFAINGWLKAFHGQAAYQVEKQRYEAVSALNDIASKELMRSCGAANLPALSQVLNTVFGLSNMEAKRDRDHKAVTFDELQREASKLIFKQGRVTRLLSEDEGKRVGRSAGIHWVESRWFYTPINRAGVEHFHWAPFVMSFDQDFFVTQHSLLEEDGSGVALYHSAYFAGKPVVSAGNMLIRSGIVRGICNDSGHYRPPRENLHAALMALRGKGIDISRIQVYEWVQGARPVKGTRFQPPEQRFQPGQAVARPAPKRPGARAGAAVPGAPPPGSYPSSLRGSGGGAPAANDGPVYSGTVASHDDGGAPAGDGPVYSGTVASHDGGGAPYQSGRPVYSDEMPPHPAAVPAGNGATYVSISGLG